LIRVPWLLVDVLPLLCRSCKKLVRNVCSAAVPLVVVGASEPLDVPALLEFPAVLVELAAPDALVVDPPRSPTNLENALLKSDMVLADRFDGLPDAAAVLPTTSLLVMS
jgi:hypothetical protein